MVKVGGSMGCAGSAFDCLQVTNRVGDGRLGQPGDGDNVAGLAFVDGRALKAPEAEHLRHAALVDQLAVAAHRLHGHVRLHDAVRHAPCQDAAEEWVRLDGGRQHPKVARRPLSAARTCFSTRSNSGAMSSFGPFGSTAIQPCLAEP